MPLLVDDSHRFCLDETPQLRARIRADLEAITKILLEAAPQASIVLSGSLAYGEGRIEQHGFRPESDYDLYLIVPRLLQARKMLRTPSPCLPKLLSLALQTDLEIVVIWSPLLWRAMTHAPGVLLAGDPIIRHVLEQPKFPYADRLLCRAYASLLRAFRTDLDPGLLRKAVTVGLRAWLLDRTTKGGSWHNKDLFSFQGNLTYLREHPGELQEPCREIAEWALLARLGQCRAHGTADPKTVLAFLERVQATIRVSPFRWAALLYLVFQARRGRSFVLPHRFISTYLTLARSLAEVCSDDGAGAIPDEILRSIERLGGTSRPGQASTNQKGWAIDEMIALANANPHKLVIPRRQQTAAKTIQPLLHHTHSRSHITHQ